jgi:hypothetical protein
MSLKLEPLWMISGDKLNFRQILQIPTILKIARNHQKSLKMTPNHHLHE